MRIVVTDAAFPNLNHERAVAAQHNATIEEARCMSPADVVKAARGAHVLLVQFAQVTREAIQVLAPNAAIVRYGLGLDNIDLRAAREKGVRVAYVPDYATTEVADHTAALILTALRKIIPLDRSVREQSWDPVGVCAPMPSFTKLIVGFIGFGRIGQEVHTRLVPFGFRSVLSDPSVDETTLNRTRTRAVDLPTLFSTVDVLTLHAPLTHATRHLVNAERLRLMKPTALIINTARGGLIDTTALEEALTEGRVGGAALDVFEEEPLPKNSKLRLLKNVVLTPHAAWYSMQALELIQASAADEVDRYLSGRPARCLAPLPE